MATRRAFVASGLCLLSLPASANEPPAVTLHGATTMVTRLIEPFGLEIERKAKVRLSVIATKSINGLVALLEGRAALAMISAPLEAEMPHLRRLLPNAPLQQLRSFEIARTSVAFATHPDNPVKFLKLDDIRRILNGDVTSWTAFGWRDVPIRPVFVKGGGGVVLTVQTHLLAGNAMTAPGAAPVDTPRQVIKAVSQEPGALALAQRQLASQAGLTLLETDGVIEQTLNIVSLGEPTDLLLRVIDAAKSVATERLF